MYNFQKQSSILVQDAHNYGVKIASEVSSKKLMLINPECSVSVFKWLARRLTTYNKHIDAGF